MATRRERVVLELQDDFTSGMARAAAATTLLDKNLKSLSGSAVRSRTDLGGTTREVDALGKSSQHSGAQIDKLSGRLKLIAQAAAVLGPGLVPIGAVAIPAVAGLASQFGFAAIGAGSLVVAAQGVGDALKAVNDAALDPTVENLEKAREAMSRLGPEAQEFVSRFQELRPVLADIRDSAAAGWFPGLTEALDHFEDVAPRIGSLFEEIGRAGGALVAGGAESLAGPRWAEFLTFIETEAPQALTELGHTVGNLTHGLAELWMAFGPLNESFSGWLLDVSRGFDSWAEGLSQTEGFRDFIAYVREQGPQVVETFKALFDAVLQIVQAAAPLGGPVLQAIEAIAQAIALIADSPAGPTILAAASAMAILSRAQAAWAAVSATSWVAGIRGANGFSASLATAAKSAGVFAVVVSSFMDTMSQMDTWERGRAASEAMAGNITELTDAIQASNVGKFAGELGVDVRRLAEDLHRNGEEGEYAKEVIDKLNASSEGFGNNISLFASDILPMWTSESSKAWEAGDDLNDIIANNADLMGAAAGAANRATYGIAGIGPTLDATARAAQGASLGLGKAEDALTDAQKAARKFEGALDSLTGWLDKREAMRNFNDSVRELGKSIKNGFGRKDIENLDAVGRNIATVAAGIENKELRADFLADARESLRKLAENAGPKARDEIDLLIRRIKILEKQNPEPEVEVKTGKAERDIINVRRLLNEIPESVTSTVIVKRRDERVGSKFGQSANPTHNADGGTIRGRRTPYGDKVLSWLAPGEEVISNRKGQADRHRSLLKAINAGRMADGGTVPWERRAPMSGASLAPGGGMSIDYDRLASAIANARPAQLYGDVHVSDGYGGFKRQMQQDRRRANLDGVRGG